MNKPPLYRQTSRSRRRMLRDCAGT